MATRYAELTAEQIEIRRQQNREAARRWREKPENRAKEAAKLKAWREANLERAKANDRRKSRYKAERIRAGLQEPWRPNEEQKQRHRERTREWIKANPDRVREHALRRRARVKGNDATGLSRADWKRIVDHFEGKCAYCSKPTARLEREHVKPLHRGGRHDVSNIVPACRKCNSSKRERLLLTEWRPPSFHPALPLFRLMSLA